MVITDNGTGFVSSDFEQFLMSNRVKHTMSSPYHPDSNGFAERAVQIVKKGLQAPFPSVWPRSCLTTG